MESKAQDSTVGRGCRDEACWLEERVPALGGSEARAPWAGPWPPAQRPMRGAALPKTLGGGHTPGEGPRGLSSAGRGGRGAHGCGHLSWASALCWAAVTSGEHGGGLWVARKEDRPRPGPGRDARGC